MSDDKPSLTARTDGHLVSPMEQLATIDRLIESKEKSTGFSWDNFLTYGPLSGVVAWITQGLVAPVIKAGHLQEHLVKNPEFQKALNVASTAAEKEALIAKTTEQSIEFAAKTGIGGQLARSQVKNPTAWKMGTAIITVGGILGWEVLVNKWRTNEVKKEIADLKELRKSWVERVAEPGRNGQIINR
jgi:hypothetical protein